MPPKKKSEKVTSSSTKTNKGKSDTDVPESAEDAMDRLRKEGIIATFAQNAKKIHRNVRDINVTNLTVTFHRSPIIEEAELSLNYGNRLI